MFRDQFSRLGGSLVRTRVFAIGLGAAAGMFAIAIWSPSSYAQPNAQEANLSQLLAAFHRAASVHDPINGDSAATIDQRIRDMLSLWTDDGSIDLEVGGAHDGNYLGNGDPDDPSTCPTPSGNASDQGTLCTFFKYVVGVVPAGEQVRRADAKLQNHYQRPRPQRHRLFRVSLLQRGPRPHERKAAMDRGDSFGIRGHGDKSRWWLGVLACERTGCGRSNSVIVEH